MSEKSQSLLPDTLEEVTAEIHTTQAALVERLQDELVCAVCGCVFIDPRVLRCQHCFCLRCLYFTVARDRTAQIDVPCAYRCEETTVTKGDIRTLPKNHYITNTCILLRQHLVRRAQLFKKKALLASKEKRVEGTLVTEESSPASSSLHGAPHAHDDNASNATDGQAARGGAAPARSAEQLLMKRENDLVAELQECEWCSCSSPSCKVCPYCWSRVCAECRGQFSDHHYLCQEPNQPGCRPSEGWLPGLSSATAAAVSVGALNDTRGATSATRPPDTPVTDGGEFYDGVAVGCAGEDENATFPFFITPSFIPTLVKECLVKQHPTPLQLSEIDISHVTPVRLAVPEVAVQCQHNNTGFSFDYAVHPPFTTEDGVFIDVDSLHWTGSGGKPSSTLSFLANATRLGETVLHDLHQLSRATADVVLELSSAAHQAYVRRNKGFHMYALHVWVLVRAQCQIARDALLPHLERARLVENLMGDLVTYRFQQMMQRAAPPQKHRIRDRCMAFLKTEIQLCRQLDQVMEGIDAACRGIYTLLGRMRDAMRELAQPKVHRGEEHKKSRQSRLRFSVQLFQSRTEDPASASTSTTAMDGGNPRGKSARTGATRRSPSHAAVAAVDPALNDAAVSDCSFRGQVCEHHGATQALTESMISILRCFMQARVWQWSLSNTCIRECVLGDEDKRILLEAEEALQLLTDDLVRGIWNCGRLVYILEVQQDEAGPASSLDILMDTETLALLDMGADNPTYDHSEVFEGLKSLSQLRNNLLNVSAANVMAARNPETQQQLLTMMTSVLTTTMQHQINVLRSVTTAEGKYERRFAAYLRTRQMVPSTGEAATISEGTLLAVDVLKALQEQQHHDVLQAAAAPSAFGDSVSGAGCSRGDATLQGQQQQQQQRGGGYLRSSRPYPTMTSAQPDADAGSAGSTPVSAHEMRGLAHTLRTDFARRDTALLSCQRYGEALVRVANGQPLGDSRGVFPAGSQTGSGYGGSGGHLAAPDEADAMARVPTGLHQLPPLPARGTSNPLRERQQAPPSSQLEREARGEEEESVGLPQFSAFDAPASSSSPALQSDCERKSSQAANAVVGPGETAAPEEDADVCDDRAVTAEAGSEDNFAGEGQGATAALAALTSPAEETLENLAGTSTPAAAGASAAASAGAAASLILAAETQVAETNDEKTEEKVHEPNPTHDELLFEADCDDATVETAPVIAPRADEACQKKATQLFGSTFNLHMITSMVRQRHVLYLPFYRGECTYKGMSTMFYVDAQTGLVYVSPQPFCGGLRRQYVLELLSSPLFFIVFNSALSILLHKRYQREIFFL